MSLFVNEVFSTLQGEAKYSGFPATFIRLYGCNMLCNYCDTLYAVNGNPKKFKHRKSIETVIKEVRLLKNRHICVTGGEPLMQGETMPLVYELAELGYLINIETNGGVLIEDDRTIRTFSYTMDIKTPCAGEANVKLNKYENLERLSTKDEVKFVIADEVDFEFAKAVVKKYPTKAPIIFSPLFRGKNSTILNDLATWIHDEKIPNVRLGVQLHKIIGIS